MSENDTLDNNTKISHLLPISNSNNVSYKNISKNESNNENLSTALMLYTFKDDIKVVNTSIQGKKFTIKSHNNIYGFNL